MRFRLAAPLLMSTFVLAACSDDSKQASTARQSRTPGVQSGAKPIETAAPLQTPDGGKQVLGPSGAAGSIVNVDAGKTALGFARGVLRDTVDVDAFSIMKYPVTVKQYKDCVTAGACSEPTFSECPSSKLPQTAMNGPDDDVALCVGYENAKAYCGYVGGRLATFSEWLRAARGAEVKAYPWGASRATCAQHPRSEDLAISKRAIALQNLSVEGCTDTDEDALRVGEHTAGASPYAAEDILLAPAELMEGEGNSACNGGLHCLTSGRFPGRIDSVGTYGTILNNGDNSKPSVSIAPAVWSFRCVVGG